MGADQTPDTDAEARLIDPVTGGATALPRVPMGRNGEIAVARPDGSAMFLGGIGSDGEYARWALLYAP